jgi:hypothetical protein
MSRIGDHAGDRLAGEDGERADVHLAHAPGRRLQRLVALHGGEAARHDVGDLGHGVIPIRVRRER